MRLSALKKETEKFKDNLVDNLHSVFSAIPDGSYNNSSPLRTSSKLVVIDKGSVK